MLPANRHSDRTGLEPPMEAIICQSTVSIMCAACTFHLGGGMSGGNGAAEPAEAALAFLKLK